jgi:hypothetical protein
MCLGAVECGLVAQRGLRRAAAAGDLRCCAPANLARVLLGHPLQHRTCVAKYGRVLMAGVVQRTTAPLLSTMSSSRCVGRRSRLVGAIGAVEWPRCAAYAMLHIRANSAPLRMVSGSAH